MPNKVNPDFLEIFQGYAAKSISLMNLLYSGTINKTTGYHRDFQILKDEVIPFMVELKGVLNGFPELFSGIKFNKEASERIIGNSIYATYNSKLNFKNNGNWKESYKMTGDMIRSGKALKPYMPEDVVSYRNFDFIRDKIENNISSMDNSKKKLLKRVNDIISNL